MQSDKFTSIHVLVDIRIYNSKNMGKPTNVTHDETAFTNKWLS
jgi:hypothetical protein